ncbi:MAG: hypothetical protein WA840_14685 [Caulobacteraceae bacterium]
MARMLRFTVAAAALLSATSAFAQTTATPPPSPTQQTTAQTPPAKAKPPHRHKTPNLEMDVDGTGEDTASAGPDTSSGPENPTESLNGSSGPSAVFPQYPTPPLPPPPALQEEPPALSPPGEPTPRT